MNLYFFEKKLHSMQLVLHLKEILEFSHTFMLNVDDLIDIIIFLFVLLPES